MITFLFHIQKCCFYDEYCKISIIIPYKCYESIDNAEVYLKLYVKSFHFTRVIFKEAKIVGKVVDKLDILW